MQRYIFFVLFSECNNNQILLAGSAKLPLSPAARFSIRHDSPELSSEFRIYFYLHTVEWRARARKNVASASGSD